MIEIFVVTVILIEISILIVVFVPGFIKLVRSPKSLMNHFKDGWQSAKLALKHHIKREKQAHFWKVFFIGIIIFPMIIATTFTTPAAPTIIKALELSKFWAGTLGALCGIVLVVIIYLLTWYNVYDTERAG